MDSKRIVWMMLLACLLGWSAPHTEDLFYINASAAQAAEVRVPVLARGADCTAVVRTADGSVYETWPLRAEQPVWLSIPAEDAGCQRFIVSLEENPPDAGAVWDSTVYELAVTAYYRSDGRLDASCTVCPIGAAGEDAKAEDIVFSNRAPGESGKTGETGTPKENGGGRPGKRIDLHPKTGGSRALEVYSAVALMAFSGLIALLRRRVKTALRQTWRRAWSRRMNRQ